MIPKIIHYAWFGRAEKPQTVMDMIATWRAAMPDYEIVEWNETNFDVGALAYTREAHAMGNYAFVADVCRLSVLYRYGGVYLDTDVEVLKTFDKFMGHKSVLGYETDAIGTGIIMAEPGVEWVRLALEYYGARHFILPWGKLDRTPGPRILTRRILPLIAADKMPVVYPVDYFCAKDWRTGDIKITSDTVSVHHLSLIHI